MNARQGRPGAVRKKGKGKAVGSGGQGRKALEGKGPTPRAEDREYHVAHKRKQLKDRSEAKQVARAAVSRPTGRSSVRTKDQSELLSGRNSVLEALRAEIPASALYIATKIEQDDRVKEIIGIANERTIPILEIQRTELDRMVNFGDVHQGIAIKVPPYEYWHPSDLVIEAKKLKEKPLLVALDGVTDPRNLGAILRSVAAFGGHGVIVPSRRGVGLTPAAWKTSAGAAARIPVAMAGNMTQTLKELKKQGLFVLGLDGGGDLQLPELEFAQQPLVLVVGSEGAGLSRLVSETADAIVSIPIHSATESLNAGIAASVSLYEIAKLRAAATVAREG